MTRPLAEVSNEPNACCRFMVVTRPVATKQNDPANAISPPVVRASLEEMSVPSGTRNAAADHSTTIAPVMIR